MARDKNHQPLAEGDRVVIEGTVVRSLDGDRGTNLTVQLDSVGVEPTALVTCNGEQVAKAEAPAA